MRTAELKKRLGITAENNQAWYTGLLNSGCVQTGRPTGSSREYLSWNDRDAAWLIRLYERNPKKTAYHPTHLVTKHYHYTQKACFIPRCLDQYKKPERPVIDQWRDMIQEAALRVRTCQIMLNTLLKDAAKAGYEPLDSWTNTSYYDKVEREQVISDTREREPNV